MFCSRQMSRDRSHPASHERNPDLVGENLGKAGGGGVDRWRRAEQVFRFRPLPACPAAELDAML